MLTALEKSKEKSTSPICSWYCGLNFGDYIGRVDDQAVHRRYFTVRDHNDVDSFMWCFWLSLPVKNRQHTVAASELRGDRFHIEGIFSTEAYHSMPVITEHKMRLLMKVILAIFLSRNRLFITTLTERVPWGSYIVICGITAFRNN